MRYDATRADSWEQHVQTLESADNGGDGRFLMKFFAKYLEGKE